MLFALRMTLALLIVIQPNLALAQNVRLPRTQLHPSQRGPDLQARRQFLSQKAWRLQRLKSGAFHQAALPRAAQGLGLPLTAGTSLGDRFVISQSKLLAQKTALSTAEAAAHSFQSLVVLGAFAYAHLLKEKLHDKHLKLETLGWSELLEETKAFAAIFPNNSATYFAVLGDRLMTRLTGQPGAAGTTANKILLHLSSQATHRPLLAHFFASSAASLITFTGFELGKHLFEMATFNLSQEEYEIAQSEFWSMLTSTLKGEDPRDQMRRQVLEKVLSNMYLILWQDDGLRSQLFYNTWRLGLMTGEFFSMVMALSSGSMAGARVASGLPSPTVVQRVLATAFGLVLGGAATLVIPQSMNDALSLFLGELRSGPNWLGLNANRMAFYKIGHISPVGMFDERLANREFDKVYNTRKEFRENLATLMLEKYLLLSNRMSELQMQNHLIEVTLKMEPQKILDLESRFKSELQGLKGAAPSLLGTHPIGKLASLFLKKSKGAEAETPQAAQIEDLRQTLYDNQQVIKTADYLRKKIQSTLLELYTEELNLFNGLFERDLEARENPQDERLRQYEISDFTHQRLTDAFNQLFIASEYLTDLFIHMDPDPKDFASYDDYQENPEKFLEKLKTKGMEEMRTYLVMKFSEDPFMQHIHTETE